MSIESKKKMDETIKQSIFNLKFITFCSSITGFIPTFGLLVDRYHYYIIGIVFHVLLAINIFIATLLGFRLVSFLIAELQNASVNSGSDDENSLNSTIVALKSVRLSVIIIGNTQSFMLMLIGVWPFMLRKSIFVWLLFGIIGTPRQILYVYAILPKSNSSVKNSKKNKVYIQMQRQISLEDLS